MSLSAQDALISIMVATAASDTGISERELALIDALIRRLPVFIGYDYKGLEQVANDAVDLINGGGIEAALDEMVAVLPDRLHDTAYALAVDVAVFDRSLPQEELRLLEMLRDRLVTERLVTAAIEAAARARMRML